MAKTDDTSTDLEVVRLELLPDAMRDYIESRVVADASDTEAVRREIMGRVFLAQTPDELLSDDGVVHARDVIGEPIEVLGVRWQRSDFEEGAGVYAVFDAVNTTTGEKVAVTCGAEKVMAKLAAADMHGWLPLRGQLVESPRPTARGYRPLDLVAIREAF